MSIHLPHIYTVLFILLVYSFIIYLFIYFPCIYLFLSTLYLNYSIFHLILLLHQLHPFFHISTAYSILIQQINSQSHKHLRAMQNQASHGNNTKLTYIPCYKQHHPETLVMLKQPSEMMEIIKRKNIFAVIKSSYFNPDQAESLSKETNSRVMIFETVKSAYTFAKNYPQQVSVYILYLKGVQEIKNKDNCYFGNQRRQVYKINGRQMKNEKVKFHELNDKQSLVKMIKDKSKLSQNRLFLSFISQRWRTSKSNRLVENMVAMLNQSLDKETAQKVSNKLKDLLNLLKQSDTEYKNNSIEDDIDRLPKDLDEQSIIKIYTADTHFDKLINSLLRSCYHPTEIFYIHVFFQKFFKTIKQKSQMSALRPRVVFRGGISSQQQNLQMRQSVGNLIQNLTFMSTSVNNQTAYKFKNGHIASMTTIEIIDQKQHAARQQAAREQGAREDDQQQLPRSLHFGCCDISQHSQFPKEQEILFNPLNSFKLQQLKQHYEKQFDEWPVQVEMKLLKIIGKISQIEQISNNQLLKISLQGHAFIDKQLNLPGCSEYWLKFQQIAVQVQHKVQALINLIYIDNNQRKFTCAIKKAQQCEKILQKAWAEGWNQTLQAKYVQIQILMIKIYEKNYQYNKAMQQWEKYIKNIKKPAIQKQYNLILQGHIFNGLGKYSQAINVYKKSIHQLEGLVDKKNQKQFLRYLEVYEALSVALKNNGSNKEAYEILRKCNNRKLKILGEDHPCYLTSLQNQANLQGEQLQLKVSLQKSFKCLKLRQLIYGKSHPLCLSSYNSIATNFFSQRKFYDSLQILLSCKVQYEQTGEKNMQYLNVLHNIACIYFQLKRTGQAISKIEQCITLREQKVQKQHLAYVRDLNTKAQMLYQLGRFQECLNLSKQIIRITSTNFEDNHPLNIQVRLRIAKSHEKLNQQDSAYRQYQKCALILTNFQHDPRNLFMNALYVLDFFRRKQKIYKSVPLLEKLFQKNANLEQKCYKSMVTTFMPICFHIYERLGKYKEVYQIFRFKQKFNSQQQKHQWNIFAYYNLFLFHIKQGDYGKAFSSLQKCLKLLKKKKAVKLKTLMPSYQMLNQIFIEQKKFVNSSNLQIYHLNSLDKLEKNPELLERKKSQFSQELRLTNQKLKSQKKKTRGSRCFIALGYT